MTMSMKMMMMFAIIAPRNGDSFAFYFNEPNVFRSKWRLFKDRATWLGSLRFISIYIWLESIFNGSQLWCFMENNFDVRYLRV